MRHSLVFLVLLTVFSGASAQTAESPLQPYIRSLEKEGMPPRDFVLKQLEKFDLLIFDDAWH
ncbi:MAG: hypothetical protein KDI06_11780, partial [Calditrichaeota bacterium]|nr:hypothetical protein [Calditrichota bacterium]